jgi:hypothetical protein
MPGAASRSELIQPGTGSGPHPQFSRLMAITRAARCAGAALLSKSCAVRAHRVRRVFTQLGARRSKSAVHTVGEMFNARAAATRFSLKKATSGPTGRHAT